MKKIAVFQSDSGDMFLTAQEAQKDELLDQFYAEYDELTDFMEGNSGIGNFPAASLQQVIAGLKMVNDAITVGILRKEEQCDCEVCPSKAVCYVAPIQLALDALNNELFQSGRMPQ